MQYDPSNYPSPRQGGDDIESAILISEIPYSNAIGELPQGYTDLYDQVCPYTNSESPDVVYSFAPADDMLITIDLCNETTNHDSKIYVFENC